MTLASNLAGLTLLVAACIWIALVVYLRARREKSLLYLLFFTIFYIYIYQVLDYTLIQYQSLILLKRLSPDLILLGQAEGDELNLLPLLGLGRDDLETSFLNVLLFLPFGFGLPFITHHRMAKTVLIALCFSFAIEALQFISGRLAGTTFRIADINDIIFNTLGAALGYLLFVVFVRICRQLTQGRALAANPLAQYINERPQLATN